MDGWIAKSPDFFLSELGDAKLKQEEVDDHLEAEAHGGVRHKPWFFPFSIFVYFSKDFTMWHLQHMVGSATNLAQHLFLFFKDFTMWSTEACPLDNVQHMGGPPQHFISIVIIVIVVIVGVVVITTTTAHG